MINWIRNPQGTIITFFMERSGDIQKPPMKRSRTIYGGIILTAALAVAVLLLVVWPSDEPATLPLAAEASVEDRLISGVASQINGEEYLLALTADGVMLQRPALAVFATGDDGTPRQIAGLPTPVDQLRDDLPAAPQMDFSNGTVYVPLAGTGGSALWIVDVSTPDSPEELATITLETEPGSVVTDGNFMAVGPMDGTIIRLFDISDPAETVQVDEFRQALAAPSSLELANQTLYITNERGVSVVDLSSTDAPREIGNWSHEDWSRGIPRTAANITPRTALEDDHLYAAGDIWGVDILDVANPDDISTTTRRLRRTQIPQGGGGDHAIDVAVTDSALYILWRKGFVGRDPSRWQYTVQEADVSAPGDPQVVSETAEITSASSLKSLAATENHVYFLNGDQIHVISPGH
ncbi:hypothetical protein BH23CHL2_BH23CHL2_20340 [soil metagenome]